MLVLGARVTPTQVVIVTVSLGLTAGLTAFLRITKLGRAIRAVANSPELSDISGIDRDATILKAFAIGSGLAGIAGILGAFDTDITPTMGLNALMMGVVVVIVGGIDSIPGIALGALLLGFAQHIGIWIIGPQWLDAIAFAILLVFLILRPQGFFGKRIKKATI